MDRLHTEMVRQLEEAEDPEVRMEVKPNRKMSVSTACQTEKVSRKVSHVARLKESPQPGPRTVSQEMTPVTRVTSTHTTERSELTGVSKLREGSIINSDQDDLRRIN